MAECTYTSLERRRIDAIAFELSSVADGFFADARDVLSDSEFELLSAYATACVRRAIEVGPLLHAIVDKQSGALAYPGRGRDSFVRASLAAWRDSFSPLPELWRLAPIFERIQGGETRVLADVAALEVMAANRMYDSLDEQCAALLSNE